MDSSRFEALTRCLSGGGTRRQMARLLAGGAVGGLSLVTGLGAVAEKRGVGTGKRGKGKGKGKDKKCRRGKKLATISVPANGNIVSTPVLDRGQRYRLRASGFWSTNAQFGQDAAAAFPFTNPNAPQRFFQGVRLGLSVENGSPDQWGNYDTEHTYELKVTGLGSRLTLRNTDPGTADNSGTVTVEVLCD